MTRTGRREDVEVGASLPRDLPPESVERLYVLLRTPWWAFMICCIMFLLVATAFGIMNVKDGRLTFELATVVSFRGGVTGLLIAGAIVSVWKMREPIKVE